MEIKRHNIVVIAASVIISAVICVVTVKSQNSKRFESRVFKVVNGWGYDILVNDRLIIHQESVPVLENKKPFTKKEEAEKTAQLVLSKLKNGKLPSLTKFDLEKIIPVDEGEHSK